MTTLREAATARRAEVRAPADRPSQRRSGLDKGTPAVARAALTGVQLREKDSDQSAGFSGFATITDAPYVMYDMFGPYNEVVAPEAVAKALAGDPDVNFVLNHGGVPFARTKSGTMTLAAAEVPEGDHAGKTGLLVDVPNLDLRMPSVQDVVRALERGDLDEMSFKFRITSGQWSPDYETYTISQFDIDRGDVSVVNYGANPHTIASLRSQFDPGVLSDDDLRQAADELQRRHASDDDEQSPSLTRNQADALSIDLRPAAPAAH